MAIRVSTSAWLAHTGCGRRGAGGESGFRAGRTIRAGRRSHSVAFDRALTAAGAKEPLAEAIVTTMNDAVTEGVATKADVAELKAEISAIEWALGFVAAVQILMAGRLFGGFRSPGGRGATRRAPYFRVASGGESAVTCA